MTEQQKDFVHMYLKHRDKIIAHNIVYGDTGNYDAAESAANRLLRIPEIADTIRSIQDNIRHEVEEEFKAKYREELMTIYEKRLLLKKIATGELYVEQKYKGKNCTQCSQYISPTINQMLAALKEDSKLAGHHPHKVAGKWVIPALQTQQEQEENTEKDLSEPCNGAENKGQHPVSYRENENTVDSQPLTEISSDSISLPFRGIGGQPAQKNPEKENKRQQIEENIIDNASPRPNGSSGRASGGGGELPQDENTEKDLPEPYYSTGNKRQQNTRPDDAIDGVTEPTQPPAVNIISRDDLHELLHPTRKAYKAFAKTGTTNLIFAAEKQNHAL